MIIKINQLEFESIIGVYPHERDAKQKVIANITIDFDGTASCQSDNLADTFDYDLVQEVVHYAESTCFQLLEKLGAEMLSRLKSFDRVNHVTLELRKPEAIQNAHYVSVTLEG